MTASSSTCAVGRGKPPLHSRFQKGQSGNQPEDDAAEQLFTAVEIFSLLQGKNQGSGEISLEDILWPEPREKAAHVDGEAREERTNEPVPAAITSEPNETELLSLLQGKTQGNGKYLVGQICPVLPSRADSADHLRAESTSRLDWSKICESRPPKPRPIFPNSWTRWNKGKPRSTARFPLPRTLKE